jgi:hypothetical protein
LFDEADEDLVAPRIPLLAEKAARVLVRGRPTGGEGATSARDGPQSWDITVEADNGTLVPGGGGATLSFDGAMRNRSANI